MTQYRKKPVVVEATQWFKNGDHPFDYSQKHVGLENGEPRTFQPEERKEKGWEGDIVRYFRRPDVEGATLCKHCACIMHHHGWIDTLEGGHIVCPGDWIITGVKGEHYPCKPDIFATTYEPAAPSPPLTPAPTGERAEPFDLTADDVQMLDDLLARSVKIVEPRESEVAGEPSRLEIAQIIEQSMHHIEWTAGKRPSIDELEKILQSDERPGISILPDGSITAGEPREDALKAADAILRLLRQRTEVGQS